MCEICWTAVHVTGYGRKICLAVTHLINVRKKSEYVAHETPVHPVVTLFHMKQKLTKILEWIMHLSGLSLYIAFSVWQLTIHNSYPLNYQWDTQSEMQLHIASYFEPCSGDRHWRIWKFFIHWIDVLWNYFLPRTGIWVSSYCYTMC